MSEAPRRPWIVLAAILLFACGDGGDADPGKEIDLGERDYRIRATRADTDLPAEVVRVLVRRQGRKVGDQSARGAPLDRVRAAPGDEVLAHVAAHEVSTVVASKEETLVFRAREAAGEAFLVRDEDVPGWRVDVTRGLSRPGGDPGLDLHHTTRHEWTGLRLRVPVPASLETRAWIASEPREVFVPVGGRLDAGRELRIRRLPLRDVVIRVPDPGPRGPTSEWAVSVLVDRGTPSGWTPEEVDALYVWDPDLRIDAAPRDGTWVASRMPDADLHVVAVGRERSGYAHRPRGATGEVVVPTDLRRLEMPPTVGGEPAAESATLYPGRLDVEAIHHLAATDADGLRARVGNVLRPEGLRIAAASEYTLHDPRRGVAYLDGEHLRALAWEPGEIRIEDAAGREITGTLRLVPLLRGTGALRHGRSGSAYERALEAPAEASGERSGSGGATVRGLPLGIYQVTLDAVASVGGRPAETVRYAGQVDLSRAKPVAVLHGRGP